jgi:uncharacterized protein YqhQ
VGTGFGGQAVLEGVMIRGPGGMAVAVRGPDGRLVLDVAPRPPATAHPLARLPLVRGCAALADGLVLGTRALLFSAEVAAGHEPASARGGEGLGWSLLVSLLFAVGLFIVVPSALAGLLRPHLHPAFLADVAEGLIRLTLLCGYLLLLSRLPEVRRMLEFHGAEHKAIAALEAGLPLEAAAAAGCTRFHPRCGTSFLLFVVLLAGICYSLLGWQGLAVRLALRLALLPLLAGAGYELLRLSAGRRRAIAALAAAPGLWLQRFTTREPDAEQLEVALAALRRALALGAGSLGGAAP